jgi:preprotein translocase subunit YajC
MGGNSGILITVGYLLFFIVVMYLLIFLPQKRKDKKAKQMLDALQVGNSIITIGGIFGRVINIKDDEVTIETSVERTKINVMKWAVKEAVKPIES